MPARGMGEGHRPAAVGRRAAHRDLAPEVDQPRRAVGQVGHQPPQGLALAEGAGVEGRVGRARDAAVFRVEPEVRQAARRPRRPQGVGRGHGPARAQSPRFDKPADGGVERAPGEALPARQLRPQPAQRGRQGERLVHRPAVEGAQDAVGPPRAERRLGALDQADHAFEPAQPRRPVRRLHHEVRPGPHQQDGAFDRGPRRGGLPPNPVRPARRRGPDAPVLAAAPRNARRRGRGGSGTSVRRKRHAAADHLIAHRDGAPARPRSLEGGSPREDGPDGRGGPSAPEADGRNERRRSHGEGRAAGRNVPGSSSDSRPSRQPMIMCAV